MVIGLVPLMSQDVTSNPFTDNTKFAHGPVRSPGEKWLSLAGRRNDHPASSNDCCEVSLDGIQEQSNQNTLDCDAQKPPMRCYLIGNSLTWDTVPQRLDGDVQWHVDCGVPLQIGRAHV